MEEFIKEGIMSVYILLILTAVVDLFMLFISIGIWFLKELHWRWRLAISLGYMIYFIWLVYRYIGFISEL